MSHGRETVAKRGPGRPPRHAHVSFAFKTGDLVLVKWNDGMVYFAKIKRIDHKRHKCVVVFDDKSQDEAHFSQIHSVDETTTDIICIKCKKDDSDKPNEIVLCDTCGIGFHQKCHMPNIPASALELDTPWNCSYCQKGIKCPYLTESLDVLQNLLSDDEDNSVIDDVESTTLGDSDHYEVDSVDDIPQAPPRKKRGRKPAASAMSTETTVTVAKREKRKINATMPPPPPYQSSTVVTMETSSKDSWKPAKSYSHEESDSEAVYISSGKSTPEPTPHVGVKRRKHHSSLSGQNKKQKRASVESRTMSVTRIPGPICESSSAEEMDTSRDSSVCDATPVSNNGLSSVKEEGSGVGHERRPRSLRVSLSIPDDVEPGTPFDKVVRAHQKMTSPHQGIETKELPSWENFADTNVVTKMSSPKQQRPQSLLTDNANDILHRKSLTVTDGSASGKSLVSTSAQSPSAFLASPLPISSSPKLKSPVVVSSVPQMNMKNKDNSSSLDVGVRGPATAASPPSAAAVGYSAQLLSSTTDETKAEVGGKSGVAVATRPTSLVVESIHQQKQSELTTVQPLRQPPQSKSLIHSEPQATPQNLPNKSTKTSVLPSLAAATSGITQPSTTSPLPSATKPVSLSSRAPAPSPSGKPIPPQHLQQHQQLLQAAASPNPSPPGLPQTTQQQPVLTSQASLPPTPSAGSATRQGYVTHSAQFSNPQPVVVASPSTQPQNNSTTIPRHQVGVIASQASPISPAQRSFTAPQARPASVPMQHKAVVPPPRPSSVPAQHHQQQAHHHQHQQRQQSQILASSLSHSPGVRTQHVLVTQSRPLSHSLATCTAPVQQTVVTQPGYSAAAVMRAPPTSAPPVYQPSPALATSVSMAPLPIPTAASASAVSSGSSSVITTQQRQLQQTVTTRKPSPTKSGGDADVIITGVESSGVIQGPNVASEKTAAPPAVAQHVVGGENGRGVLVNSPASVAYHQAAGSVNHTPAGTVVGRKAVIARTVDVQQMVPAGSSNQAGSLVTQVAGQQSPVSVVPVVITPNSDHPSTQVLYQVADQVATPQGVISGGATAVRTPPLRSTSSSSSRPSTQPGASVIVATVSSANVAHSPASLPASVVYSPIGQNVVGFSSVTTTKPYAIVNAMPGTQIVYTTSQGIQPSPGGVVTTPPGSLPQPPKTYSLIDKPSEGGKLHHRDVVQTISKKIGDAFDSGNEQLLVAAFEDAWKKFQANGKQYEHSVITASAAKTPSGKEQPPPNAEVFTLPGTTSRMNIVRQTSGNRLIAPKTTSPLQVQQVIAPPPLSSKGQANYVGTTAAQQQLYLQPATVNSTAFKSSGQQPQPSSQHSKVHSSGLFYPPSSTSSMAVTQKNITGAVGTQRVIGTQNAPVVRQSNSEKSHGGGRTRTNKSKVCSRCGKAATYLCSGCHAEWYCGRDCQLKSWDVHADHCKA